MKCCGKRMMEGRYEFRCELCCKTVQKQVTLPLNIERSQLATLGGQHGKKGP